ncbi:MAG: FHA domain-containing protein [Candidatus Eremiobacterota bacterium]
MDELLDSRFELVVLEGGGKDTHHYLNRTRVTLGRLDPADEPQPGVATFPEPTVSRVHAVLEWDPRKHRFRLHHRSRTNHTVVNGKQMDLPHLLQAGDRIKLGHLVLEVRQVDPREAHVPFEQDPPAFLPNNDTFLLAVMGPERGALHPLNHSRMMLRIPPSEPSTTPGIYSPSAGDVQATLFHEGDRVFLLSPRGERPIVVRSHPSFVAEWVVGTEGRFEMLTGDLLLCDRVAFLVCNTVQAGQAAEILQQGGDLQQLHPALGHLRPGQDPLYAGPELLQLRILSGSLRGSRLWLRPDALTAPLSVGRAGLDPPCMIELPDKGAARLEMDFGDRVLVRNADTDLRITQNWDLLTPSEEAYAVSGDRFVLGRTVLRFEKVPVQAVVDRYSIKSGDQELPLLREENTVGYRTESDLRIDDRRLSPVHAVLKVDTEGVVYRHQHKEAPARVGDRTVQVGEEVRLIVEQTVELVPGISIELIERTVRVNLTEPTLIGPTQEEIEAGREAAP